MFALLVVDAIEVAFACVGVVLVGVIAILFEEDGFLELRVVHFYF